MSKSGSFCSFEKKDRVTHLVQKSALLDGYRTDIAEGTAKVERLQEKLQELESQKTENEQVISDADRKITLHKNSTRAEVFRLKGERCPFVSPSSTSNICM